MDSLLFGLGVTGIGLLVVFAGLIILIVFIKILTSITGAAQGKKAKAPAASATPVAPIAAPAIAPAQPQGVSDDVLAAITAAIAAVWQGPTGFVVRHVRRVSNAPAWNRAGREEQTYSRF